MSEAYKKRQLEWRRKHDRDRARKARWLARRKANLLEVRLGVSD